ncbi:MAG: response regulator [Anaerolineae bacterium]|nr:response regulator [Anaerolineae bacterium]
MAAHRILVADDDMDALRLVGLMLERKGYEVITATSGQQTLDKALETQPELIILDVMMPDMDGYKVAMQLRKESATQAIPILMFTAKTAINDKIAGFQAGADDYLTKPIHPAELITRVETLLQRKTQTSSELQKGCILAFLPGKGGIGTTTLTINTAIELKRRYRDKQVVLIELKDGSGAIAMHLGLATATGNIQTLMEQPILGLNKESIQATLVQHNTGIHVLLSTPQPMGTGPAITKERVRTVLRYLAADYDYLLLDLPPILDEATTEALRTANKIILTLEPTPIGVNLAKEMMKSLENQAVADKTQIVLINRVMTTTMPDYKSIEQQFQHGLVARIPPTPDLAYESIQKGIPMGILQPEGQISQQVRLVVQSITKN